MNNNHKIKFINIMITTFILGSFSYINQIFCQWWGCNNISFINILRGDLICNSCLDISYHLKNHQIAIYSGIFALLSSKLTHLIYKAESSTHKYIFEDYSLGKKSPRELNPKFK